MNKLNPDEIDRIRNVVRDTVLHAAGLSLVRRQTSVKITTISINNRSFAEIRDDMEAFEGEYREYDSFVIRQHGDGLGDEKWAYVYGLRDETDEELIERETGVRERAELRERADREDFERLSARFGQQS